MNLTWANERRRLRELVAWEHNPRQIGKAQASRLADSLEQFGQIHAIAIGPDGEIYDGHQRTNVWAAVDKFGPDYEVDVRVASRPLTEAERRKLVTYLHSGTTGDWDWDALSGWDVGELVTWGFDAEQVTAWDNDAANLRTMIEAEAEEPPADPGAQVDRAEELREKWGVESGQLWRLGEHRLICGDCTDAGVVARVMGGERARGVFTSPPYAMQRKDAYGGVPVDEYAEWWHGVQGLISSVLAVDGSLFLNIKEHSENTARPVYVHELVVAHVKMWGWVYIDEFCWERVGIPGSPEKMGKFKNQWEPVFWFSKTDRPKFEPSRAMRDGEAILDNNYQPTLAKPQGTGRSVVGDRKKGRGRVYPGNRLPMFGNAEATGHEAAFPVGLAEFFVRVYSDDGDIWYEPFCDSGTTIIAAERLGRRCRAVEIEPKYVAVTIERWVDMTGKTPELVG